MNDQIASIQARLKNVYKQSQSSHQLILTRYFQERLLYRLSQTRFKNKFLLKGGVLIYALNGVASRPTLDLDLMAQKMPANPEVLRDIFQEIGQVDHPQDGVVFDTSQIELSEINKEGDYKGSRIKIRVSLGNIRQWLQIDIGFGDRVVPGPMSIQFPTLLAMQGPELLAYSKEFREDVGRNQQWITFLVRANLEKDIEFPTVMALIQQKLEPIYRKLLR